MLSRTLRSAVLCSLLVFLAAPLVATRNEVQAAAKGCPERVFAHGNWVTIRGPVFTNLSGEEDQGSPQGIESYAVDPATPTSLLFASNSESLMRTADGGCSWRMAYPTVAESPVRPIDRVREVAHSISHVQSPAPGHVWLLENCQVACEVGTEGVSEGAVVVSHDGGLTWSKRTAGLPSSPLAGFKFLRVAPARPNIAYVVVGANWWVERASAKAISGAGLYGTEDGGKSWDLRADLAAPGDLEGQDWNTLTIDPLDPGVLWLGGERLMRSNDGGRSWEVVLGQEVGALAVQHFPGREPLIYGGVSSFMIESRDGGQEFRTMPDSPGGVTSIAVGALPGDLVVTAGSRDNAVVLRHAPVGRNWELISDGTTDSFAGAASVSGTQPLFFVKGARNEADPPAVIERYTASPQAGLSIPQFQIPTLDSGANGCPPPAPPFAWQEGWDPVPKGSGPIYVTDFYSGATLRYNRFGTGTVIAIAPMYTENTALDPLGRIITTTRHSDVLTRLDPTDCSLITIDPDLPTNEGPSFDRLGNLFVNDTDGARVYEYSWPQYPGQNPKLVYDFQVVTGRDHYIEDVRVAPQSSPFAGDLLINYADVARFCAIDDGKCQAEGVSSDAIARLTRTEDGWDRLADVIDLRAIDPNFNALGFAVHPDDGSLIVPDFSGSSGGKVWRIAPDGRTWSVFAVIPPLPGERLGKVDIVQPDGYVYITSNSGHCAGIPDADTGVTRLIRLDPEGNRLEPDFTHNSSNRCFVGISVPHEFEVLPDPPLPPLAPPTISIPVGAAVPPLQPPQPPVLPAPAVVLQLVPNLGPIPVAEPAPAPAPQPQPQPQGQPQAGIVTQRQEQPQLALVHAAQRLKQQLAAEHSMVRARNTGDPLLAAKFGLGMVAISLILAYGYLALSFGRRPAQVMARRKERL